jgi:hypothetical protein
MMAPSTSAGSASGNTTLPLDTSIGCGAAGCWAGVVACGAVVAAGVGLSAIGALVGTGVWLAHADTNMAKTTNIINNLVGKGFILILISFVILFCF